jgi:hypothetical protein
MATSQSSPIQAQETLGDNTPAIDTYDETPPPPDQPPT